LKIPLKNDIIDFIFPKICILSDIKLTPNNSNQYIDDKFLNSIQRVNINDLLELKLKLKSDYSYSLFRFQEDSDTQKLIHYLKFEGMKRLGYFLGKYFANELINKTEFKNADIFKIITPVPLHKIKFRERGYNQSDYICRGMNEVLNLKYIEDLIIRKKNTTTQTHLSIHERELNVKNAFIKNLDHKNEFRDSNIILIDDVITTGATLNEIIKVLRKSGVNKIMCLSLAMAVR
jgi:ComF family protein